jgi:ABC-type antimicrobial peptide transport system permease subunit
MAANRASDCSLPVAHSLLHWGRIVSDGREYVIDGRWISLFPGLAILFTVMGMNLLGDWLREALDPKDLILIGTFNRSQTRWAV